MRVVKLGGSLLETGKMFDCLKHILNSDVQTIAVCGGGEFSNLVRNVQKKWQFDDVAAHEMAILAMQQTAIMCQNLQHEFVIVASILKIKQHYFSIWSPDIKELNAGNIKSSWEITSDSLAAWLAIQLNADELVIVKSCDIDSAMTVTELSERCIVDTEFSSFIAEATFDLNVISTKGFLNL